jgi:hypothetical protein
MIGGNNESSTISNSRSARNNGVMDAVNKGIAGAEAEIGRLQSLEDKLKGNDTYWANQVEVQRLAAAGILAHVRGDDEKAVALVRAAADLDATMDKHPATRRQCCRLASYWPICCSNSTNQRRQWSSTGRC